MIIKIARHICKNGDRYNDCMIVSTEVGALSIGTMNFDPG